MKMEEEDERLVETYVVVDNGMFHAIWKMNDSKLSEKCHHLRAPKDSQDKTKRRRTNLTNLS